MVIKREREIELLPVVSEEALGEPGNAMSTFLLSLHEHAQQQAHQHCEDDARKDVLAAVWGIIVQWTDTVRHTVHTVDGE